MDINRILERLRYCRSNEEISIVELENIMKMNGEAILLDVRSVQEYREGHLNRSN